MRELAVIPAHASLHPQGFSFALFVQQEGLLDVPGIVKYPLVLRSSDQTFTEALRLSISWSIPP